MRHIQTRSGVSRESGIVILMVAVVLLFVVGAMAALAIDVVSLYTARSEAQLAADGAALAGARVLANSGMTSNPTDGTLALSAEALATTVATQVATSDQVGGRNLLSGEVLVTFDVTDATNPRVTVKTGRTDLPTFFARIWGNSALVVAASATAEAYNPSGAATPPLSGPITPVAPTCVKPWVLPNIDPTLGSPNRIFDPTTGAIQNSALLAWDGATPPTRMWARCQNCTIGSPIPSLWRYYAGAPADFTAPSASSVACAGSAGFTAYQLSVAGCVQTPIACNSTVSIDMSDYANRDEETTDSVNCLTHSTAVANNGDSIDTVSLPSPPFQFLAGADNPVVQAGAVAAGTDILVSNSLVTVPVYDSTGAAPTGTNPVTIIGFVQLFLNPDGLGVPNIGPDTDHIRTRIINLAGCGTGATGQPILGNGASAVPVRLVTPP